MMLGDKHLISKEVLSLRAQGRQEIVVNGKKMTHPNQAIYSNGKKPLQDPWLGNRTV
jgi:hypothetical protein